MGSQASLSNRLKNSENRVVELFPVALSDYLSSYFEKFDSDLNFSIDCNFESFTVLVVISLRVTNSTKTSTLTLNGSFNPFDLSP